LTEQAKNYMKARQSNGQARFLAFLATSWSSADAQHLRSEKNEKQMTTVYISPASVLVGNKH
jgi:hypothetical protein